MDIIYVQYTHIFTHVKVDICRRREAVCPWLWILAFTPGVANLNMTVLQSDLGVADIMTVDFERSLAVRFVTDVWSNCYGLVILNVYAL
jgi:hypothetical protein